MMQFTKDAYRELNQYEQHFTRAVKGGYTMGITPKLAQNFLDWYKALGGNKHINLGCSNCVYTMMKDLGNAYFAFVADAKENHPSWLGLQEKEEEKKEEEKVAEEEPAQNDNEEVNEGEGGVVKVKQPAKTKGKGKGKTKNKTEVKTDDGKDNG